MKKVALVAAVALLGLALGAAVAGRPQDVSNDVISSDIALPEAMPSTTAPTPATPRPGPTSTSDPPPTTPESPSTVSATSTSTSTPGTTTTLVAVGAIRVVVANATNAPGLATRAAVSLESQGYTNTTSTDALTDRQDTVVVYSDGFAGEAQRLAEQVGIESVQVQPRPAGVLTESDGGGQLWLLLGLDQV